jgi:hypothetical protein
MYFRMKSSFNRAVPGPVPVLVTVCVIGILVSLPSHAKLNDPRPAVGWSPVDAGGNPEEKNNWLEYELQGEFLYDSEGGLSTDSSNGGASFGADSDIASGYPPAAVPVSCTTVGDTLCGDKVSAWFYYHDADPDPDADTTDDVLFLRVRVDDNPSGNTVGFNQSHWNFLLNIEEPPPIGLDAYKELWIDVDGSFNGGSKADRVRILYENNDDNDVTNGDGAYGTLPGAGTCGGQSKSGGTVINSFLACKADGIADCMSGTDELSHTRVVDIGDGTGEYYVDVMVPVPALTDNDGCYSNPKNLTDVDELVPGNQVVFSPTDFTMLYSTSDSATDPMQKDFVAHEFGDPASTPVTLASFSSQADGGTVRFEWTTSTETANAGFDILEFDGERWQRVNKHLIPSNAVNSTTPQHYSFVAEASTGSLFKIVDVSTDIKSRRHGPFDLGLNYGQPAMAEQIDWHAVRKEHATKAQVRRRAAVRRPSPGESIEVDAKRGMRSARRRFAVCDLEVSESGLYRVTGSELAAAGCDLDGVRRWALALMNRGESVPIRVEAAGRDFGPDGFVEFYGEAEDSFYTRTNVYQLLVAPRFVERVKVDRRVPSVHREAPTTYSESLLVDSNRAYSFVSPTGDPWFNTSMVAQADTPLAIDFPLYVDHLGKGQAMLNVGLWGVTNWPDNPADHHAQVWLNGTLLWDEYFDGLVDLSLNIELPDGLLQEGENTMSLVLPGDTGVRFEMVNLDTYGVEYPRAFAARQGRLDFEADAKVFEVGELPSSEVVVYFAGDGHRGSDLWFVDRVETAPSGEGVTARFAGTNGEARYFVSTVDGLLKPLIVPPRAPDDIVSGSAEYLVISHADFLGDLGPLLEAREARGWQVRVVDVDDVFNRFGFGIVDPKAIREYIAYAVENMGTRAVLLVGGDTYDYLDYLGVGSLSFIPTLYTNTGSGAEFTPTDALLADGDGDQVPDVAIGRLPVRTSAELEAIIDKILDYEAGGHHYTAVYAADGDEPGTPFTTTSLKLVNELPGNWHVTRAHIDDSDAAGARTALLAALNQGVAFASFVGHSGPNRWTFDGLFTSEDVAALTNDGAPAVVSQWGCWNTYFVEPEVETMAHAFMLTAGGGAAAVLGASTITTFLEDDAFSPLLQRHLTTTGKSIGEAMLDAKRELALVNPGMLEVILGVNLLGDPAIVLAP